jgi:hypothetical protein
MKKLIFVLALLLMAAPASAKVTFEFEPSEEPWMEEDINIAYNEGYVFYDANGENGLVRAFALKLTLDDPNAFIDWVWREGRIGDQYWVSPSNTSVEEGEVEGGELIAEDDSDLGGEDGLAYAIIEAASLYAEDENSPDVNGGFFGISVGGDAGSTVCITLEAEPIRGGIVKENASPAAFQQIGEWCLELPTLADLECNGVLTMEQLGHWFDWGEPDNWCTPCFYLGDQDEDGFITFNDFIVVFQDFKNADSSTDPNAADSDIDMDGFITFNDFLVVFQNFKNGVTCP